MAYRRTEHPGITVGKNRHGKYYARWRDPDSLQFVSEAFSKHGFTTKTQAANWLKSKSNEIKGTKQRAAVTGRQVNIRSDWPTIEDAYLEYFEAENGEKAASRTKRDWLKRWREYLAKQRIVQGGELTANNLTGFRSSLAKAGLAPSTRNRTLGTIKAYLTWGIDNGYVRINSDHLRKMLKPFKVASYQPRVLNQSELRQLLTALADHDTQRHFSSRGNKAAYNDSEAVAVGNTKYRRLGTFTLLALLTGARPTEVLTLKWQDIDFIAGEIHIWGNKTQRERIVPLHDSPVLQDLLTALRLKRGKNLHVCGDWADGQPSEIHDRQWQRLIKLAELASVSMKALRSTCVAHVASASSESEYLLEARFGHGANVSKRHYRKPLHGLSKRGETVEHWLGIEKELRAAMEVLGMGSPNKAAKAAIA